MGAMSRLLATSKAAVENPMVDFSHISWHPFNSIELSWSDIYFSAACIFKMMGDGNYTDTDLGKSTHPDNRVRQLYCASILGQINKEYGFGISEKSVEDIVTNAFNKAESYCNCALEMKTNTDVFRREYFRQHPILKQMKELWRDDVYDSLEPLAYMPIVGPNGEPIPLDAPKT